MFSRRMPIALAASLTLAMPAVAQTATPPAPPMRVRATLERLDANTMVVKANDGAEMRVVMAPGFKVTGVKEAAIEDVKPGSYVGCAATTQEDGTLKAVEVTVFPASMKGAGEGSYAWDLGPSSTMTNGTVGDVVVAAGRVMTVKFNGVGERKIYVPIGVPIVTLDPADESLLTPGAHVIVTPVKAADGTLIASRANVGENGIIPPM